VIECLSESFLVAAEDADMTWGVLLLLFYLVQKHKCTKDAYEGGAVPGAIGQIWTVMSIYGGIGMEAPVSGCGIVHLIMCD
jgi:hypothetical protein